jgi:chitin disaccharide deacetylase
VIRLVVNADDFGRSHGVNRGIAEACDRGIVTSASLMVRYEAAAEAAALARDRPRLGLGLHVDLGEWVHRDGEWEAVYERGGDVEAEVAAQLDAFERLVGAGPTHLDSHQHAHLREPARSALERLGAELGVPVRHLDRQVRYLGAFYGQTETGEPLPALVSAGALVALLERLEDGTTELACHPGYVHDLESTYRHERELELRALCDPRVRAVVRARGIRLVDFRR